jgi:hypothetical protein
MLALDCCGVSMTVDWYLADLAVRVTGGLLFITCACLPFRLLQCAGEAFAIEATPAMEVTLSAQDVIAIASDRDRSNVRPEHVPFYDFVTARGPHGAR